MIAQSVSAAINCSQCVRRVLRKLEFSKILEGDSTAKVARQNFRQ